MQLQTILNRVERHKSFVYKKVRWDETASRLTLRVFVDHRSNGRPICSGCHQVRPGYDRLRERTWEFVPLWQIAMLFVYAPRRVKCPECGSSPTGPVASYVNGARERCVASWNR